MERIDYITRKWWFFVILVISQFLFLPYASKNFQVEQINTIIYTTLTNSIQLKISSYSVYFQILSLIILVLLIVLKNRMKLIFNLYVAVSYILFAFVQNIAITEKYGWSIVTVNVIMFLFVAYVWVIEILQSKNDYSFSPFQWKYSWMILLSLFAYLCPLSADGFNFNPAHFVYKNSATAFCLTTPLFLTLMTLNIPRINIVTYRVTAIIGFIIGLYNMLSFLNPYTINIGILHLPLLIISLYACLLSYRIKPFSVQNK
ncbi:hypothetical protein [Odoribacter laneus]|uniref:hypothetical protein n=1 Tax=Odoribacter laneus TaxID=626933 RepID=UPI003994207E